MLQIAMGFGGPQDILIIGVVVMVLFGGSKLSGFAKSAGVAIKEFKKSVHDEMPVTGIDEKLVQTTPNP